MIDLDAIKFYPILIIFITGHIQYVYQKLVKYRDNMENRPKYLFIIAILMPVTAGIFSSLKNNMEYRSKLSTFLISFLIPFLAGIITKHTLTAKKMKKLQTDMKTLQTKADNMVDEIFLHLVGKIEEDQEIIKKLNKELEEMKSSSISSRDSGNESVSSFVEDLVFTDKYE